MRWIVIAVWWLTLFLLVLAIDISDDFLFALVVTIYPAILLAVFILGVLVWVLGAAIYSAFRRRRNAIFHWLAVPVVGGALMFAGRLVGDEWQIRVIGKDLAGAVAQAKQGIAVATPLEATAAGAYLAIGPFFDVEQGIAYDTSDRIEEMLALEIGERPDDWLDKMPKAFSCTGGARHLGGHYWKTNLDRYECAR
jgi:hypothetical protein